jgi:hypothetical protein
MSNGAILGVIAALLAGGSWAKGKGNITGIPDLPSGTTTTPAIPSTMPAGENIALGVSPGIKASLKVDAITDIPKTSTPAGITVMKQGSDLKVKQPVITSKIGRTTITTAPTAIPAAASSWKWYTPEGIIESRPPTQEEKDSGMGCPEIPGYWERIQNPTPLRYCANPECPSNQREWIAVSAEGAHWSDPTPAVLEQEVDASGMISYYCRVCRNRT